MKIKEHGRQINQDLMWMFKLSCITAGAGLILFLLGKMIPLNEDLVDGSFTAFILSCLLSFVLLFFLHDGIKDEQFAAEFFECVHQGKYFSSATWQKTTVTTEIPTGSVLFVPLICTEICSSDI